MVKTKDLMLFKSAIETDGISKLVVLPSLLSKSIKDLQFNGICISNKYLGTLCRLGGSGWVGRLLYPVLTTSGHTSLSLDHPRVP